MPEEPDDGDERFQTEYKTTFTQPNLKESSAAAYSILHQIFLSVIPVGWESQKSGYDYLLMMRESLRQVKESGNEFQITDGTPFASAVIHLRSR